MGQAVRNNLWHLGLAPMLAWPILMMRVLFGQVGYFAVAVFYAAISLTMVLVLALESEKPLDARSKTSAAVLACLFVCLSCLPPALGLDSLFTYIAAVLCGSATALGYIAWARPYASLDTSDRVYLGWTSLAICAPLTLASLASGLVASACAALLCIVSFICAHRTKELASPAAAEEPKRTFKENIRVALPLWRIAASVVIYSFAVGVSWPLLLGSDPFSRLTSAYSFVFLVLLLAGAMLVFSIAFNFKLTFNRPWRIVVLLLSASILIAPQVDGFIADITISMVRTTEVAITALWFMALASISKTNRLDPGHTVGFGWLYFSLPCALGVVFGHALLSINPLTTVLPACTVLALVAVAFFVGDEAIAPLEEIKGESPSTETGNAAAAVPPDGYDPLSARCALVASEFGLTNREAEIFDLLAHGRSGVHIAEALTLSENTVKGHTKRLYAKLGVHTRQELIDLVAHDPF